MHLRYIVILCLLLVGACDPNAKAEYGDSGMPKNCRAYVQTAIDGYKAKSYTAEEAMAGLERNCGEYGSSWGSQ